MITTVGNGPKLEKLYFQCISVNILAAILNFIRSFLVPAYVLQHVAIGGSYAEGTRNSLYYFITTCGHHGMYFHSPQWYRILPQWYVLYFCLTGRTVDLLISASTQTSELHTHCAKTTSLGDGNFSPPLNPMNPPSNVRSGSSTLQNVSWGPHPWPGERRHIRDPYLA